MESYTIFTALAFHEHTKKRTRDVKQARATTTITLVCRCWHLASRHEATQTRRPEGVAFERPPSSTGVLPATTGQDEVEKAPSEGWKRGQPFKEKGPKGARKSVALAS